MSIIDFIPTFSYFKKYDDLSGTLLDFGSNSGNLIRSSLLSIRQSDYIGLDVYRPAIDAGRRSFPKAQWLHSTRYHPCYNPDGDQSLPILPTYDKVFSYSVFSHFSLDEILTTLNHLKTGLKPGGKMFFSYCNIQNIECVEWFRNRRESCEHIDSSRDFTYLVDNHNSLTVPDRCAHFVSFFNPDFLLDIIRVAGFNAISQPTPPLWYQDCLIILPPADGTEASLRSQQS